MAQSNIYLFTTWIEYTIADADLDSNYEIDLDGDHAAHDWIDIS